MSVNTLDELSKESYAKAEAGIVAYRASKRTREDEHVLYDVLTQSGLSDESADEYINLEVEEPRD